MVSVIRSSRSWAKPPFMPNLSLLVPADAAKLYSQSMSKTKSWPAISIAEAHARLTAPGSRFETVEVDIRGQRMAVWKHLPNTASAVFAIGRGFGAREFLVHEDERVSFDGFSRAALAIAAELKARGVAKGDRVGLVMRNLPEWPAVFFGSLLAGA